MGRRRRLRKVSMEKLSAFGGAVQAAVTSRRTKSVALDDNGGSLTPQSERRMSGWLLGIPPLIARKLSSDNISSSTEDSSDTKSNLSARSSAPKPAVLRIPATRLRSADHKGFLDRRNKKSSGKGNDNSFLRFKSFKITTETDVFLYDCGATVKLANLFMFDHYVLSYADAKQDCPELFWCVLQDTCLYCYNAPQSDVTRDAVLLRGYDVVADVTNLNRTRFVFRLQQKGVPTLHFSSDNHRDFLLWVGTMEKETRYVTGHTKRKSLNDPSDSTSDSSNQDTTSGLPIEATRPTTHKPLTRTVSQDRLDNELMTMHKHRILKDIAVEQQRILEEQKLLEGSTTQQPKTARRMSRVEVFENYESAKSEEEVKVTKFLTHLNRRRNSAQLKMDQFTKELAPKNGRRRRDNHAQFSAMEGRLKEMQDALAQVDREIEEEEAAKQHNLEKLQHKRDLELIILEQRETLDILRRHRNTGFSHVRRRHSIQEVGSQSAMSCDTLASIDEMSSISDDHCASDATSASSSSETPGPISNANPQLHRAMSTPRSNRHSTDILKLPNLCTRSNSAPVNRRPSNDGATSSDADSGFQASRATEDLDDSPNFKPRDGAVEQVNSDRVGPCRKISLDSAASGEKVAKSRKERKDEIDITTLAKIEEFENFARAKLSRQHSKT
ncbi:uncharacterized protein LOC100187201 [Ciona intestinalis]